MTRGLLHIAGRVPAATQIGFLVSPHLVSARRRVGVNMGGPIPRDAIRLVVVGEPGREVSGLANIDRIPALRAVAGKNVVSGFRLERSPNRVYPVGVLDAGLPGPDDRGNVSHWNLQAGKGPFRDSTLSGYPMGIARVPPWYNFGDGSTSIKASGPDQRAKAHVGRSPCRSKGRDRASRGQARQEVEPQAHNLARNPQDRTYVRYGYRGVDRV